MAIYHYHREIGKRSTGKNGVFGAAYIRGEKRTCDRIGETKDFSNKPDIVYKNTFLPIDAPSWALSLRSSFVSDSEGNKHTDACGEQFSTYAWNQIEFAEKRVDSQIYFHDDFALPNLLTKEQAIDLVNDFVSNHLAIDGIFCDAAIHWDENNHHVHVLMPMRTLTDEGFSKKIRRSKSDLALEVHRVREAWAVKVNETMHALGINERIDHRSYKDRGIALAATIKVGKFTYFPDQSISIRKLQENDIIRMANSEAIKANPNILADKIIQEHTEFDSQSVMNEIHRHVILEQLRSEDDVTHQPVDPILERLLKSIQTEEGIFNERALKKSVLEQVDTEEEYQRIYNSIMSHERIVSLGLGDDGREHYVGRHAFDLENNLLRATHELSKRNTFKVSRRLVNQVSVKFGLNAAQSRALLHLTRSGNAAVVCGYAGTGKTYMLKAAREVWEKSGYHLIGLATAGKAASGLEMETGIASKTIYGFLRSFKNNQIQINEKTILVMDEMGMTSLDDMSAVLDIARSHGAKFTGVGDVEQTQPVGRGAPQRAMVDSLGTVFLDTIIRQETEWQRQATTYFETNQTALGFDLYERHGQVHLHETYAQAQQETVSKWFEQYSKHSDASIKEFIITAFKNESVAEMNSLARAHLVTQGVINQGDWVTTETGTLSIAVGERLLFTKNDSRRGVRNGDFATVLAHSKEQNTLSVQLDGGAVIDVNYKDYQQFTYGYAATVHKLQGHTAKECHVLIDGDGWDRHKFLVAATRHKSALTIHAAEEHFVDLTHLKESVSRHGLNDILTDFPVAFAERRGFDVKTSATTASRMIQNSKTKIFDAVSYLFNYQTAIEQGQSAYELSKKELEVRRNDAVIVAEFCDNRQEMAVKLNQLDALNDLEKETLHQSIYKIQQRNGEIAAVIKQNPDHYTRALERNRVSRDKIDAACTFHEHHQFVASLITEYNNSNTPQPNEAFELIDNLKAYYSHICQQMTDKEMRTEWLSTMESYADTYRRNQALELFGLEQRPLINTASRYKALDQAISVRLKGLEHATELDKQEMYRDGIIRDSLAFELASNPLYETILTHFAIKPERIAKHVGKYHDRQFVKSFSEHKSSSKIQGNLTKQAAAHRIKNEPKRYGIFVNEFLSDGWKSINLENWLYARRKMVAQSSHQVKASMKQVQRYKHAASSAYSQWQKAIKRSKKESPHKNKGYKQAQGLSFKRSLLAHELMGNIHQHVAALSQEKVDTHKLYQQAKQVDYLNRYRFETRDTLKLRMARFINDNLKDFQAGLAVYGLYQDVKERATHFAYLQRIKNASLPEMKTLIRLAVDYQDKKVDAGRTWGQIKALKQLKIDTHGLELQAKQLIVQRNAAAHNLLNACSHREWLTKELTETQLDRVTLERESSQYLAYKDVMRYLSLPTEERGKLAQNLLSNKATYHLLFDNNISFDGLKKEAKQYELLAQVKAEATNKTVSSEKRPAKPLWDIDRINQALMNNPVDTYTAILGEPNERKPNHLRYSGGLIIATQGADAGKWYSHVEEVGGSPLSAIQKYLHLSFPQALAYGASLAGLSDFEATLSSTKIPVARPQVAPIDTQSKKQIHGRLSAQSIWDSTIEVHGTLAERYFKEHRKVDSIEGMAIRYWPKGAVWTDYDEQGVRIEKPNKIPAAVIAARNAEGDVVSVQRIYLDEKTAGKNTFLKDAKLTKGSNKGAPGVIQMGKKGGVLYIAEGPETAASIARLDKEATVLVSFSVSNISNMVDVIHTHQPQQVFIAADNDGEDAASRKTTEKACVTLREAGIDVRIVYPNALPGKQKTDWNDVLVAKGKDALLSEFKEQIAKTKFLYEQATLCQGTIAAHYINFGDTSVDLNDVRFLNKMDYKGQIVPALLVPRTNVAGLLCGETVFALSPDGKTIISEGSKKHSQEGFYMAQKGMGETLIIADTLLHAKIVAQKNPNATVVLSKSDEYEQLHTHLTAQTILPKKVIVLSETHERDQQILIAHSCKKFQGDGAELYLMNSTEELMSKLDPLALEKSRLKMSFEKLISVKPAVLEENSGQTPQQRFNELQKEFPILKQYEQDSKERRVAYGYAREQMDKQLVSLAKTITADKKLMATLQKDLPKLAKDVTRRIQQAQKHQRGF
ncbi:TPA: AAA family ATPase [Legionella pneumophila]|nr:AAA family ATPase [Legionella pneumophila]